MMTPQYVGTTPASDASRKPSAYCLPMIQMRGCVIEELGRQDVVMVLAALGQDESILVREAVLEQLTGGN